MIADSSVRYGVVTRLLHWIMALGFAWMLLTACARAINEDAAFTKAVFQYHSQVGFTILMLGVLRILWAFGQSKNRPSNSLMAKAGHGAMYLLMVLVPSLALLRTFGGGRAFTYLDSFTIIQATEQKVQGLIDLGNNFHGELGWLLFALILGHILMVIKHRMVGGTEDVLPRIL